MGAHYDNAHMKHIFEHIPIRYQSLTILVYISTMLDTDSSDNLLVHEKQQLISMIMCMIHATCQAHKESLNMTTRQAPILMVRNTAIRTKT